MIDLPDADHLYFGWWLKEPAESDGAYAFRTFSGGTVPFAVGGKSSHPAITTSCLARRRIKAGRRAGM